MTEVRKRPTKKQEEPRILYNRDEDRSIDELERNKNYDTSLWTKVVCMTLFAICGLLCAVVVFFYVNPGLLWYLWTHPESFSKFVFPGDEREVKKSSWMAEAIELTNEEGHHHVSKNQQCSDDFIECSDSQARVKRGHMKPIGEHRMPDLDIDELPFMLSSRDFYKHYIRRRRPVVFRGAARHFPAFHLWKNESYLREKYGSDHFRVEPFRSYTNQSYPLHKTMTLNEFLDRYHDEPIYLDSPCPRRKLNEDILFPDCLACEEMIQGMSSVTLLISSGNTSSSLHHDGYENLISIISGSKMVMLFNTSQSWFMYGDEFLTHPAISPIEPVAVDMDKYPLFAESHYGAVTLNPGDVMYIPQNWWHYVQSSGTTTIGFNVWWAQFTYESQMDREGLNEDVDVTAVIELFDRMVEKEALEIKCQNQWRTIAEIMEKIGARDALLPKVIGKFPSMVLADGYEIPMLGFGTAGLFGETAMSSVKHAIKVGYKMIDSAQGYDEAAVGQGIVESGVDRSSIFLISKLHPRYLGYQSTLDAVQLSLKNLQTDYLDAFLIHSIDCDDGDDARLPCGPGEPKGTWQESWKAMEMLHHDGVIHSLGVSNFDVPLLKELLSLATVPVSLVQNWFDPYYQDRDVRKLCADNGIAYMGYSTLGAAWKESGIVNYNPVLQDESQLMHIATEQEATISQIVLCWAMNSRVIVIPRSSIPLHININLLSVNIDLTEDERATIDKLEGKFRMPDDELKDYYMKLDKRQMESLDDQESGFGVPADIPVGKPMVHRSVEKKDHVIFVASDDGIMYALDAVTGAVQWLFRTEDEVGSSAAISTDGSKLYFGSDDGHIYSLSTHDGTVIWKFNTGDAVTASPLLTSENTIYCGSQNGQFYALDAVDGTMLYEVSLKGPIWSSAALNSHSGTVYVGSLSEDEDNFYALRAKDGFQVWSYRAQYGVWSSPRITSDGKTVVFGDQDGCLHALDADNGNERWKLETKGATVDSSVAISEDSRTIFVGTGKSGLLAADLVTGQLKWSVEFPDEIVSSPLLHDGVLYFGVGNGEVVALSASDEKEILWRFRTGESVMASPALSSKGFLYIGSVDHTIYALNSKTGSVQWTHKTYGPVVATATILTP